jgi:sodium-dependent dicarboxylate transporter 2/3/5
MMKISKVLLLIMDKLITLFHKKAHLIGPFLFLTILLVPLELDPNQHKFLAIFILVVANWLFSKTPIFITGFIGVGLSVLMGVTTADKAFIPFSHPIIFLFMGGFLFAKAMNSQGLDKRISLVLLSQDFIKGSFKRMVLSLFILTAFFSMWVSNTATTAMMLPIILGILTNLKIEDEKLTSLLLIGMAYSASIGGVGTPIGSIPNMIAIGMLSDLAGIQISFLNWTLIGIPLVSIFIYLLYKYICLYIPEKYNKFDNTYVKNELKALTKISKEEKIIALLFSLTVFFWFSPSIAQLFVTKGSTLAVFFKERFNVGIISMFFSSLLFIFPLNKSDKILKQNDIKTIDWPSLLLFGSGLSLGKMLFETGLAKIAGDYVVASLASGNIFIILVVLIYVTIFATELASNTATSNILLPIVISMAATMNLNPIVLASAVAISCSLAFMLPVATPPNAIVYGSGKVTMGSMIKTGFLLNIIFGFILIIGFYIFSKF